MRLLPRPGEAARDVTPIRVPTLEGLEVFPYIRHRLVCAHLLARVLNSRTYDLLLIDLPYFMNHGGWLELPLGLFPFVSLAVFKGSYGPHRAIAFAPNDAACLAAFLAMRRSLPYRCLDDSDMMNYPDNAIFHPRVEMPDDYRILHVGLERFFSPLWDQLEAAWPKASRVERFFSRYRAQTVVRHLRAAFAPGTRTLLVCEFRLWWLLEKALREESRRQPRYLFRWNETPGILRVEDPVIAWVHGLLDDYPAVTLDFWESVKSSARQNPRGTGPERKGRGRVISFPRGGTIRKKTGRHVVEDKNPSFDKLLALEAHLGEALTGKDVTDQESEARVSVRDLIHFHSYLTRLSVSCQRVVPAPGTHLFHAAEACGGRRFLRSLARRLTRYPDLPRGEAFKLLLKSYGVIVVDGHGLDVPDHDQLSSYHTGRPFTSSPDWMSPLLGYGETEARRGVLDRIYRKLSREEKGNFPRGTAGCGCRFATVTDYELHARACAHARLLAERRTKQFVPRRSLGSLEGGIDWKATLAARARGEKGMYVKRRIYSQGSSTGGDEFTPVVFLFTDDAAIDTSDSFTIHDANLAQRNLDLGNRAFPFDRHPEADMVFSVYGTTSSTETLLANHIQRESVTSVAFLYTRPLMGPARYRMISRRKPWQQCRSGPDSDPELSQLPKSERVVAWAAKYARDTVLLVSPRGWQAPPATAELMRRRGVRIRQVPISAFRPDFLARLRRLYFLSPELKTHPQRDQIVRRFIE
jgi:hypothetical protein